MINIENLPQELLDEINTSSKRMEIPANEIIVSAGDNMEFIPFVVNGNIRVYIENDEVNKELLLYYLEEGQTCMMSIIAGFTDRISKVSATSETATSIMLIPANKIREWQIKYEEWNNLILNLFINRYNDLIETIEALSFMKIEDRLLYYLKANADENGRVTLNKNNQKIAKDIATSREVVSRTLKKLENDEKIKYSVENDQFIILRNEHS